MDAKIILILVFLVIFCFVGLAIGFYMYRRGKQTQVLSKNQQAIYDYMMLELSFSKNIQNCTTQVKNASIVLDSIGVVVTLRGQCPPGHKESLNPGKLSNVMCEPDPEPTLSDDQKKIIVSPLFCAVSAPSPAA